MMDDTSALGPMSMVKIDGAKIKRLREEQGLTQLYLATAVQVTTDTISRWENRRYPSVKKENALKLAETLNVKLEELLEEEIVNRDEEQSPTELQAAPPPPTQGEGMPPRPASIRNILILILVLAGVAVSAWLYFRKLPAAVTFTAERILPAHCIAGQPFPVLIKVTGDHEKPAAFIIREHLPPNATVIKVSPEPSTSGKKDASIKWLHKISGTEILAYMVTVTGKEDDTVTFSGTADVSNDTDQASPIGGDSTTVISHYHWADTDKDNVISDSEILSVYEKYGEVKGIGIDIDQIEEIWLGSGYTWNPTTATFEIHE